MLRPLPIWFQAVALVVLSCTLLVTANWVWEIDAQIGGRARRVSDGTIHGWLPLLIVFLGTRFIVQFLMERNKRWPTTLVGIVALLFVLPALWLMIFIPSMQRNREAGSMALVKAKSQIL